MILGRTPIGETIKQMRTDQGLTRAQLANKAGIMERTLGRIENGEHPRCEWDTVIGILNEGLGAFLEITFREPDKTA